MLLRTDLCIWFMVDSPLEGVLMGKFNLRFAIQGVLDNSNFTIIRVFACLRGDSLTSNKQRKSKGSIS